MKCLNCNSEKFEEKRIRVPLEFRGETIEAIVPAFVCVKCEEPLMNDEQMSALRQEVADTYRRQNELLTAKEITDFRKRLDLSQREFAAYLEVGEASIKRWETHFIQDKSQDEHIRIKCDKEYAQMHVFDLGIMLGEDDEYQGNREFNWDRFKNTALYLVKTCKSPLFLNKALFYADFLNFKKHNASITGCVYAKLDYGPCPDDFRMLFRKMTNEGLIKQGQGHNLIALEKPQMDLFDDNEKATLEAIRARTEKDAGQALYDLSHEEAAYEKTEYYARISYKFATKLKF
ncbi:MAG: type II TA system antitoxin MqsA family protein [Bacteriovoracia bacterium]